MTPVKTLNGEAMEEKADEFMSVSNLCMETLMEKFFSGDVGDNTLFIAFSDGKKVDCAVAGRGINLVNTLCSCCHDNRGVFLILSKVVEKMEEEEKNKEFMRFLKELKDIITEQESDEE